MKAYITLILFLCLACTTYAQTSEKNADTSTTEVVSKIKVKVYPNPATSVINVLGLKNTSKASISISDIYGNIVLTHKWEIRRNAINVPITTLVSGAYIVTIRSKEQIVRTKFYKK